MKALQFAYPNVHSVNQDSTPGSTIAKHETLSIGSEEFVFKISHFNERKFFFFFVKKHSKAE
jgi:hypothetical protein